MSDPILELLASPPSPSLSVDENAVYAGGRRRVRQRALRRTAFGVAGVMAASAVAFAAIGPGFGGEALPAGEPSVSAQKPHATSALVLDGTYAVEVITGAAPDQPNVKFYKVDNGKRTYLAGSLVDPTVVSFGTGTGADGVMLGTAPADASKFSNLADAPGGFSMDQQLLPGTDYQAVALKFDDAKDVDTYKDTLWMSDNGDGLVRDGMGNVLPSAKVVDDTFFVDGEQRTVGVFTRDGAYTKPLTGGETTTLGYGERANGQWSWRSITLLPAGATKVEFTWSGAQQHTVAHVTPLDGLNRVVVTADATAPESSSGPIVTKVTWTDAAGTRHTESAD